MHFPAKPFVRPVDFVGLTRPFTLLAPFSGILAGALAAASAMNAPLGIFWVSILAAAASAALLNAASNAFNQACDVEADAVNKPQRPIPSGRVSENEAVALAGALYLAALGLAWSVNIVFFALAAFAAVLTVLYSWHAVRLKGRGWVANATVALSRGMLLIVAGWSVVAFPSTAAPWFIGGIFGLFLLGAATTKDFADMAGDARQNVRTLPIIYGTERAARSVAPFLVLPFLLFPLGAALGILPAAAGLLAALSAWGAYAAYLVIKNPEGLSRGSNHPSWKHMYLMMVAGYAGMVISYWI